MSNERGLHKIDNTEQNANNTDPEVQYDEFDPELVWNLAPNSISWTLPEFFSSGMDKWDAEENCDLLERNDLIWRLPSISELEFAFNNDFLSTNRAAFYLEEGETEWENYFFMSSEELSSGKNKVIDLKTGDQVDIEYAHTVCVNGDLINTDTIEVSNDNNLEEIIELAFEPNLEFFKIPLSRTKESEIEIIVTSNEVLSDAVCSLNNISRECEVVNGTVINMTLTGLLNRSYLIKVAGISAGGEESESIEYEFEFDTIVNAPTLSSYPASSVIAYSQSGNVRATFNISGILFLPSYEEVQFRWDGGDWGVTENSIVSSDVGVGNHVFEVRIVDDLGNVSEIESYNWTVLPRFYSQTVAGDIVIKDRGSSGSNGSSYWFTSLFASTDWVTANLGCSNLIYAGYSDWMLPSKTILEEWENNNLAIYVSANMDYDIWSSTTGSNGWKYYVNLYDGYTNISPTDHTKYVRCIRLI